MHEGRVPMLIEYLRNAAQLPDEPDTPTFQILLNTHSVKVMAALRDDEIVAADNVATIDPISKTRSTKTRMRTGIKDSSDLLDPETNLTRFEVERLLQHATDAA